MLLCVVLLAAGVATSTYIEARSTVTVTVYYDSMDSKSKEFITKQLYPTYVAVNKGYLTMNTPMRLELVVYSDCPGEKTPQNRREACANAKLHTCAIAVSRAENNWSPLNFIHCALSTPHYPTNSFHWAAGCAARTCFDDRTMSSCVNTVDGDILMLANRDRTLALTQSMNATPSNFPVVTFDGVYSESEQVWARENLLSLVCDKTGRKVGACRAARASETMKHDNYGSGMFYPERVHCYFWANDRHWENEANNANNRVNALLLELLVNGRVERQDL